MIFTRHDKIEESSRQLEGGILKKPTQRTLGRLTTRELVEGGFINQRADHQEANHALENQRKEAEILRFTKSIKIELREYFEIIEKPPAGEEYRLFTCSVAGKKQLGLYGGFGYEMFSELWTISFPKKKEFDLKWEPNRLNFDIFTADKVSLYQSTFSVLESSNTALIVGGNLRLGQAYSLYTQNNDVFSVDLNTFKARLVKSPEDPGPGFRKFHTANFINSSLYIVGGINAKDEPQSEVWRLKLSKLSVNSQQHGDVDDVSDRRAGPGRRRRGELSPQPSSNLHTFWVQNSLRQEDSDFWRGAKRES